MTGNGVMSPCGLYRYWLSRTWDPAKPTLVFVMLNPSTANALVDDPTIRKCVGFAKRAGYGAIEVVNLYAFRATKPKDLFKTIRYSGRYAIGLDNDNWIREVCVRPDRTVCIAWGRLPNRWIKEWASQVLEELQRARVAIHSLRLNGDGSPAHPLMLAYSNKLEERHG
jgi:hypothetical protein